MRDGRLRLGHAPRDHLEHRARLAHLGVLRQRARRARRRAGGRGRRRAGRRRAPPCSSAARRRRGRCGPRARSPCRPARAGRCPPRRPAAARRGWPAARRRRRRRPAAGGRRGLAPAGCAGCAASSPSLGVWRRRSRASAAGSSSPPLVLGGRLGVRAASSPPAPCRLLALLADDGDGRAELGALALADQDLAAAPRRS